MKPLKKLLSMLPAVLALTLSAPALAEGGRVPVPDIPKAVKGDECVEDTAEMRRNHMKYLLNHRDATMHQGIRTKKYSLNQCLECHVPAAEQQAQAGEGATEHFCQSCHAYAAVNIDCFECHATRPQKAVVFHPLVTPAMQATKDVHTPDSTVLLNQLAGSLPMEGADEANH